MYMCNVVLLLCYEGPTPKKGTLILKYDLLQFAQVAQAVR